MVTLHFFDLHWLHHTNLRQTDLRAIRVIFFIFKFFGATCLKLIWSRFFIFVMLVPDLVHSLKSLYFLKVLQGSHEYSKSKNTSNQLPRIFFWSFHSLLYYILLQTFIPLSDDKYPLIFSNLIMCLRTEFRNMPSSSTEKAYEIQVFKKMLQF
jgi:hypothetical protein